MSTEVVEPPKTERQELELSGEAFETRKAATPPEKAEPEKFETVPAKTEPEKKEDAPEKKDETTAAKPEEKTKGKTPLDVAPKIAATDKKDVPVEDEVKALQEEVATLLKTEPPANASASSKANHAALRKGLERANATIEKLSAGLKEAATKTAVVPEDIQQRLAAAETAVKERDELLERVAFERSPRYQKFVSESEAELSAARSYLEGADAVKNTEGEAIDPGVIDLAAKAKGSKRLSILSQSGMDAATISAVTSHLARADAIDREREAAQANWKTTHAEWTAEQQKAAEANAAKVREKEEKVFKAVGTKVAETLAPFQRTDDNEEWNQSVDARLAQAQEFFEGKKSLEETSELVYKGLACDVYKDAFEDLRGKYNDLVAENGRIKAARPGAADSSAETTTLPATGDPMKIAGDAFEANRQKRGL